MSETKTYVFPEGGSSDNSSLIAMLAPMLQNRGIDPSVLYALNNNNGGLFGGNGMWGGLIALIVIAGLFGGNGGFFGNNNNSSTERDMIMSAIQRNGSDLSQLAASLNSTTAQVQNGINNLATAMATLSGQNGLSAQQIINSIQSGNQGIISQLASCCCDTRNAITTQGYENRIANLEQTNVLGSKMDMNANAISAQIAAQTTDINDHFCALETRELQNKISSLQEANSALKSQIDNAAQTAAIQAYQAQTIAPINAALTSMQNELTTIKGQLPATVTVPSNQGVYLPAGVAYASGLYGYGYGYNNSLWG